MTHTAFISGASRGIGLEFARQLAERGGRVFAGCRRPDSAADLHALAERLPGQIELIALDVADESSIRAAAAAVAARTDHLDLLINNAGTVDRSQALDDLDFEICIETFKINAFAPILLAQQCLPLLRRGKAAKIASISSEYGSLTEKASGDLYTYCASKAALNMFTRTLAFDVWQMGITAVILDPGWVRTAMGGWDAELSPTESVEGMLRVLDDLTIADAGRFIRWDGLERPW